MPWTERRDTMAKSVYSVVLSDEVVAAVDRLAYREGTSRSRMIERILAQYASCDTPAQRMADVFNQIEQMAALHGQLQLLFNQSDELLQLKSAVPYKYNPTVKYAVELSERIPGCIGELRVTLRSQSAGLLQAINRFYHLWAQLEARTFQDASFLSCRIDAGRYTRTLRRASEDPVQLGSAIAAYIQLMDSSMKAYFNALPNETAALQAAAGIFGQARSGTMQAL